MSDNTSNVLTISLTAGAYDPMACSSCSRKFASYNAWLGHWCAALNDAHPINVRRAEAGEVASEQSGSDHRER